MHALHYTSHFPPQHAVSFPTTAHSESGCMSMCCHSPTVTTHVTHAKLLLNNVALSIFNAIKPYLHQLHPWTELSPRHHTLFTQPAKQHWKIGCLLLLYILPHSMVTQPCKIHQICCNLDDLSSSLGHHIIDTSSPHHAHSFPCSMYPLGCPFYDKYLNDFVAAIIHKTGQQPVQIHVSLYTLFFYCCMLCHLPPQHIPDLPCAGFFYVVLPM